MSFPSVIYSLYSDRNFVVYVRHIQSTQRQKLCRFRPSYTAYTAPETLSFPPVLYSLYSAGNFVSSSRKELAQHQKVKDCRNTAKGLYIGGSRFSFPAILAFIFSGTFSVCVPAVPAPLPAIAAPFSILTRRPESRGVVPPKRHLKVGAKAILRTETVD